ncbi:MAG: hypothetical protein JOS17DRAFT_718795 [Linnemannia elongata]|nr:MAG: hypothetical protein JOS17DRAFT_718795 [Linnemannia elongata]
MAEVLPTATATPVAQQDSSYSTRVKENVKERLTSFKSGIRLGELSGSLGDLGTLLPILLSLSLTGQVDLTASLIFGGVWNIVTGIVFRMPMCVQPMKSIAAIALTNKMSMGSVMGAGMSVSAVIMVLGLTRTIYLVKRYTPIAVIRGIQLGTAVSFGGKAAELILKANSFGGEGWDWANNYEWACVTFIIVFLFYYRSKRIPTAIIIFMLGLIIAFIKLYTNPPAKVVYPKIGVYTVSTIVPTPEEFKHGFLSAGLGQIPLTALNSVIALAALANDLFPEKPAGTPTIAVSIGAMNLIGCFFGSMPFCHGSGGLAAQYRFGARTEVSIIILGILKIFFGLFFGSSLSGLIACFPTAILGVMLFVSGIELGAVARTVNDGVYDDQKRHANFIVMITTASMLVGFKNDGIGFLGGMVGAGCFYLAARFGGSMDEDNTGVLGQQQDQHGHATTQDTLPASRGSDDEDQSSIRKVPVETEQQPRA